MLGVVIPAHNEAAHIGACLQSIQAAASHSALQGERVLVIVVADACNDFTESIAVSHGALVLSIDKRDVGSARDWGARLAVAHEARWLAFTDADTTVPWTGWSVSSIARRRRCAAS